MGRFSVKKSESCCLLNLTISSHWPHYIPPLETTLIRPGCINRKWLSWDRENYIFQKVTNMGSIIGQKIDYNGRGSKRPAAHTQQTLTQVLPPPSRGFKPHGPKHWFVEIIRPLNWLPIQFWSSIPKHVTTSCTFQSCLNDYTFQTNLC